MLLLPLVDQGLQLVFMAQRTRILAFIHAPGKGSRFMGVPSGGLMSRAHHVMTTTVTPRRL